MFAPILSVALLGQCGCTAHATPRAVVVEQVTTTTTTYYRPHRRPLPPGWVWPEPTNLHPLQPITRVIWLPWVRR